MSLTLFHQAVYPTTALALLADHNESAVGQIEGSRLVRHLDGSFSLVPKPLAFCVGEACASIAKHLWQKVISAFTSVDKVIASVLPIFPVASAYEMHFAGIAGNVGNVNNGRATGVDWSIHQSEDRSDREESQEEEGGDISGRVIIGTIVERDPITGELNVRPGTYAGISGEGFTMTGKKFHSNEHELSSVKKERSDFGKETVDRILVDGNTIVVHDLESLSSYFLGDSMSLTLSHQAVCPTTATMLKLSADHNECAVGQIEGSRLVRHLDGLFSLVPKPLAFCVGEGCASVAKHLWQKVTSAFTLNDTGESPVFPIGMAFVMAAIVVGIIGPKRIKRIGTPTGGAIIGGMSGAMLGLPVCPALFAGETTFITAVLAAGICVCLPVAAGILAGVSLRKITSVAAQVFKKHFIHPEIERAPCETTIICRKKMVILIHSFDR